MRRRNVIAALLSPGFAGATCPPGTDSFSEAQRAKGTSFKGPLDLVTLERDNTAWTRETGQAARFRHLNEHWKELRAVMITGDKIFYMEHQQGGSFMNGHALVRGDCIVYFLLLSIS